MSTTVTLTLKSRNVKTGPMPVSTTSATTCPDACPLKAAGCYAKSGPLALVWRGVTEGTRGTDWATFTKQVAALPAGTLWRHNQAGDLPGEGNAIDTAALSDLVKANQGRKGFTFTHKPMDSASNRDAIVNANANGFTINLSANTLADADRLSDLAIGPVAVVLDAVDGVRHDMATPDGRKVVTCPATYREDVTCQSCGLCQKHNRKVIVGFPAHGNAKRAAAVVARG